MRGLLQELRGKTVTIVTTAQEVSGVLSIGRAGYHYLELSNGSQWYFNPDFVTSLELELPDNGKSSQD